MVILDTNHFSELNRGTEIGERLKQRLLERDAAVFITVVTAEEAMAGWLPRIRRTQPADSLLKSYTDFQRGLDALAEANILPWSAEASDIFEELRSARIRIGTLDLRIASIALNYDATVLTRNLVDFQLVSGLRIENWLD